MRSQLDLVALEGRAVLVMPDVGLANSPASYSAVTAATLPYGNTIRLADLDGDNDQDVLVVTQLSPEVSWFENLGGGGSLGTQQPLTPPANVIGGDVSDLDGDGDLDVAVLAFAGAYALDGDGLGGFSPPRLLASLNLFPVGGGWNIECGYLDLDGDDDVAFTNAAGIWWTENSGAGIFGPAELLTVGLAGHRRLELIDMDGDGDRDILTAGGDPNLKSLSTSQNLAIPDAGHDCTGAVQVFSPQAAGIDTATGNPLSLPWACAGSSVGADFWYAYQVLPGSAAFGVDLTGPFATALEVFEGTCGGLNLVACDSGNRASEVFVDPATPGQTYLVRVGQTTTVDGYGIVHFTDPGPPPAPCFDNPSFETGDLTGWTAVNIPSPFIPLGVSAPGVDPGFGLFPTDTSDGGFAFRTGFDGPGPGTIELSQTIAVVPDVAPMTFNYRAGWTILDPTAMLDRTFKVVVHDASTGAILQSDLLLTAAAQTTNFDTGWLLGEIDLSGFIGQEVRLAFEWYIPENNTGPAHFQLDNFLCANVPDPGTGIGSAYCSTRLNASGRLGEIHADGSLFASDNNLTLFVSNVPQNQTGIFVTSQTQDFVWLAGGTSNGHVCVGGSIGRFGAIRNSGPAGAYTLTVDLTAIPQGNGQMSALAGQTWNFQSWFRDPMGAGSNFTNGVAVTLQ